MRLNVQDLTRAANLKFLRILLLVLGCALLVQLGTMRPSSAAATPAGTQISNTVNATYVDSSAANYSTNSNTVVTVVQNAPSFTMAGSVGVTTVPGQNITDSFTLTNTGNNGAGYPGHFQLDGAPSISLAGTTITGYTYTYNGATSGSYATVAALNTALNAATNVVNVTATGATDFVTINVTYSVPTTAAIGAFTDTMLANLTYPGGGAGMTAWAASTTADSSLAITDTIVTDARMDLQLASVQTPVTGILNYTLTANNGGSTGTADLAAAKALIPGPAVNGVLITEAIPQFGGSPLTLSSTVTIATSNAYGYGATSHYHIYYTNSANGSAGWTSAGAVDGAGTVPAGSTYIAVYVYGGAGGVEFAGDAGNSTPTSVTHAAMTVQFSVNPPTGAGSANANSVPNIMNAMWGDNESTKHILGPDIPIGTADAAVATQLYTGVQGLNNASSPPGGGYVNGYSNATSDHALSTSGVANGPCCTAASLAITGSYDGVVAVSTNNDFTAAGFTQTGFVSANSATVPGSPTGNNTTATATINVENAVQNTGNATATITLVATAPTTPAGWTVILDADAAGSPGAALGGATSGATSTASVSVTSGTVLNYWAVYTAPAATPTLTRYDANIVASTGGASDTTHNELYNGYVALTLTPTITSNGCPAGLTPGPTGVCPSGVIQYVLDYRNIVVGCATGAENTTNACLSMNPNAGTLLLTEDGTGGTAATPSNNWSTYTLGLVGIPSEVVAGTNGASTFTYTPGPGAPGATKFTARIGAAAGRLAPGTSGTLTYSMTVK